MPKYVSIDHLGIAFFRVEFPDVYSDFPVMAKKAFEVWGDLMDREDSEGIAYVANQCVSHQLPFLQHSTRLYVTTEYLHPHLVLADTPQYLIDHMFSVLDSDDTVRAEERWLDYLDCIVVWLFQGDRLVRCTPINPGVLAKLVTAFHRENLVAVDHVRRNWNFRK